MRSTERDAQLRDATGRVVARWGQGRAEIEREALPPQPGDTFVLAGGGDLLVEWLVVGEDGDDARLLLVAADDFAETGSRDVPLGAGSALANVRCGAVLRLDGAALDPAQRTGSLSAQVLDEVRRRRQALSEGTLAGSLSQLEVDDDPVYQRRMKELDEMCGALEALHGSSSRHAPAGPDLPANVTEFRRPPRASGARRRHRFALAASVLLMMGLGAVTIHQQRRLAAPHPNLPVIWLAESEPVRSVQDPYVVPSGARRVALIVEVASPESYPRYRVELLSVDGGDAVWSSDELVESGSELSFDLPRSLLATGSYELRVYGLVGGPSSANGKDQVGELLRRDFVSITLD